ncbi:restriction endonuclease subunit S [Halovulum sp. GXIMD14794]
MADRIDLPLYDVVEKLIDYRGKSPKKSATGIPVISAKVVKSGRILENIEQTIAPEYYDEWMRRGLPEIGDVVMTTEGPMGEVAQLDARTSSYALGQRIVTLRGKPGVLHNGYLKFLLMSPEVQARLEARATGTTVLGISQKQLRDLPLPLVGYAEQEAIAALLGALDDKIDLNRRMSATLEEMARALYRSWFVDFDPVHARALGHPPAHMDATTAALFPDSFGPDGLPKGWRSGEVGNLITLQRGFDLPKKERQDGPFPVVAAGGLHGTHSEFKVKGPGVTTGRSGVIGQVYLVPEDFWPLNTSLWIKEFRGCSPYYAYFLLEALDLKALNSGSAVPSLNRNNVHNLPSAVPPRDIITAFDASAQPLFARKHQVEAEAGLISELRDTLLPRLMSGELRVRAVEKLVEEPF